MRLENVQHELHWARSFARQARNNVTRILPALSLGGGAGDSCGGANFDRGLPG